MMLVGLLMQNVEAFEAGKYYDYETVSSSGSGDDLWWMILFWIVVILVFVKGDGSGSDRGNSGRLD